MHSKAAVLILAIALSACTTPAERRQHKPKLDLSSSKSSKDVALCITDKWENAKPFMEFSSPPVNTNMRANGYSIAVTETNGYGSTTTMLADIMDDPQGSLIKYYRPGGLGFGDYDEAVKACL